MRTLATGTFTKGSFTSNIHTAVSLINRLSGCKNHDINFSTYDLSYHCFYKKYHSHPLTGARLPVDDEVIFLGFNYLYKHLKFSC